MTGLILCGGTSSRMGSDKGLLLQDGRHWVERSVELLMACGLKTVVSVAAHNIAAYQQVLPDTVMISDAENLAIGGPLKGLLSVHQSLPAEDLLVLAVDMQAMQPTYINQIIAASMEADAQAVIFQNGDQLEPLCAWYRADGLNRILQLVQQGMLRRFSMHHVLEHLNTKIIQVPDDPAFQNFNTPEDLSHL